MRSRNGATPPPITLALMGVEGGGPGVPAAYAMIVAPHAPHQLVDQARSTSL